MYPIFCLTTSAGDSSIRETSFKFGLNRNKIRKALVTSGEISSELTDEALKLRKQGLSIKEISKHLGVSAATVSIYLPYEDNIHNSLEPSQHTLDVRNYRAYEKARKQRMSNKKDDRQKLYQSESDSKREDRDNMKVSKEPQTKVEKQLKRLNTKVGEYTLPNGLIRIHASLEGVDKKAAEILKKYGCVKYGNTVTRDLIVPQDMPLRALHFALQRTFGFQDSHLHLFTISEEDLKAVSDDNMRNLLNLRGVIFTQMRDDGFTGYEPVFQGGNFKKWLKKQYTYPWKYDGDYLEEFHDPGYYHIFESDYELPVNYKSEKEVEGR